MPRVPDHRRAAGFLWEVRKLCPHRTSERAGRPLRGGCREARENLRETDKKETRILVQTHPDVLVIPPDPPQMMIKVDQVRRVIGSIYFRPREARERVYIFTDSAL